MAVPESARFVSSAKAEVSSPVTDGAGRAHDSRYLAFFDCFNRGKFFEAHEVLETLWLANRREPNADFYKGLIQLAGAFIHVQKNRLPPAARLLRRSRENLAGFPARHESLDLGRVRTLIETWLGRVETCRAEALPLAPESMPRLDLGSGRE